MAEAQSKVNSEIQSENNQPEVKYHIRPNRHFDYNSKTKEWNLEVHLPGVKKENIKFRVLPTYFDLEAIRDDVKYSLSGHFPWDVNVDEVKGSYENGLLYIKGKIKDPMDDAFSINLE